MLEQANLLLLARQKLGNVTYYRLGKELGITSSYMTQLKKNKTIMSDELAFRLAHMCGLPPEYVVASIECERMRKYGDEPVHLQMAQMYHRMAQKFVASILLVGLALLTVAGKASAAELVLSWSGDCQTTTFYIMRNWARRRRRLAKLLRCLKTFVATPLSPPCARNRSTASAPKSWRRSGACTSAPRGAGNAPANARAGSSAWSVYVIAASWMTYTGRGAGGAWCAAS
jgi:hypothetical protein